MKPITLFDGIAATVSFEYFPHKTRGTKTVCTVQLYEGELPKMNLVGECRPYSRAMEDFHTGRRVALNRALQGLWPAIRLSGWQNSPVTGQAEKVRIPLPENRRWRKAVWDGMLSRGFRPIKEPEIKKLKRQLFTLRVNMGLVKP